MLSFIQRIGRIGIATEKYVCPPRPQAFKYIEIPPRLYFDFDALVAGGKRNFDFSLQLFNRILDANRDSARNFLSCSSQQLPQGNLFGLGFGVPKCILQGSFCHTMSTDTRKLMSTIASSSEGFAQECWRKKVFNYQPCGIGKFFAIERTGIGHAFSPAVDALAVNGDEKNAASFDAPEAGFKVVDQRHV